MIGNNHWILTIFQTLIQELTHVIVLTTQYFQALLLFPFFFTYGKTKIQRIYKYGYTKNLYNLHLNFKSFDSHFNYHSICSDHSLGSENEQKQINAETPSCYFMVHSCSLSRKQYLISSVTLSRSLLFKPVYFISKMGIMIHFNLDRQFEEAYLFNYCILLSFSSSFCLLFLPYFDLVALIFQESRIHNIFPEAFCRHSFQGSFL